MGTLGRRPVNERKFPPMATLERMLGLDEGRPTPVPDDDTPTNPGLGQYVEAERPTRPALGSAALCPSCGGAGRILRVVEGRGGYRSRITDCQRCAGTGCLL